MTKPKPKFIYDEKNKKRGVLLTIKDFEVLIDALEDYYDYKTIKKREKYEGDTVPFEQVLASLSRNKGSAHVLRQAQDERIFYKNSKEVLMSFDKLRMSAFFIKIHM